jgi:parallel beta-helix repeat protein
MRKIVLSRGGALLGALACLAAVSLAVPATASASVKSLTNCGSITVPGKYRLDANVTGTDICFIIFANDVTLRLNGHTVQGQSADLGIFVIGAKVDIVGPGTVTGWGAAGIGFVNPPTGQGGSGSVRHVTVTNNGGVGIGIASAGNEIRHNEITDNGSGIHVFSGAGNTITGNFVHNNASFDMEDEDANCGSNVWRHNDFATANVGCIH